MCDTGSFMPVTQGFSVHSKDALDIYDSKGLETDHADFASQVSNKIAEITKDPGAAIIVWYCINCTSPELSVFEQEFIRTTLKKVPVLFLVTKCDTPNTLEKWETTMAIKTKLESYKFLNNKGVHFIISDRKINEQIWCPKCYESGMYDNEKTTLECDACKIVTDCKAKTCGIEDLITKSADLMPAYAKLSFVAMQMASVSQKSKNCLEVTKLIVQHTKFDIQGTHLDDKSTILATILSNYDFKHQAEWIEQTFKEKKHTFLLESLQSTSNMNEMIVDTVRMYFLAYLCS